MAAITKSAFADIDANSAMYAPNYPYYRAAVNMSGATFVELDNDGELIPATTQEACLGITFKPVKAGQIVAVYGVGTRGGYGNSMTPGARLYLDGSGGLDDAPQVGVDEVGVARAIDAEHIMVLCL